MLGETIGRYRILSKLGEGGMGEVYRAEDSSLGRAVALKFLAAHLLHDAEGKQRFLREARAAAVITHPNICHVYEVGEEGGKTFLAMAYLEGESLEERVARGPLPLQEALEIGRQIAAGLEAAHEKGIVHRDIKPANVMVDAKGHATILDFGLARLTEASKLTRADQTVGTAAYMSPEQIQGAEVDHRTDVWALGCTLYEMVAGLRPFKGQYDQALAYEIVNQEPEPLTSIRAGVPMELEFIVGKCLAKDCEERYRHAEEVGVDLKSLLKKLASGQTALSNVGRISAPQHLAGLEPAQALSAYRVIEQLENRGDQAAYLAEDTERKRSVSIRILTQTAVRKLQRKERLLVVAAVLGMGFAAAFGSLWLLQSGASQPLPLRKFTVEAQLQGESIEEVKISPDGRYLAYKLDDALWIRDLHEERARPVEGAEGVYSLFWSPDSRFVGFATGDQLNKVAVTGGASTTICRPCIALGGSWSPDGETIVFSRYQDGSPPVLVEVPAVGGSPRPLIDPEKPSNSGWTLSPSFLPAGASVKSVLFERRESEDGDTINVLNLATGNEFSLATGARHPVYSSSGHVLYHTGGEGYPAIWAIPFSLDSLEATGEAFPVRQGARDPDVGNEGTLAFRESSSSIKQLVWRDRQGRLQGAVGQPQERLEMPSLSPDGRLVAVRAMDGTTNFDIWVHDIGRDVKTRLTFDAAEENRPIWSSDGRDLYFSSNRGEDRKGFAVFSRPANGRGDAGLVFAGDSEMDIWCQSASRDGRYLICGHRTGGSDDQDVSYLRRTGDGCAWEMVPFLRTPFRTSSPQLSPDGRFVTYESNESGRNEIYVMSFPDGDERWQVSANGGKQARWRGDGEEIFYVEHKTLMAVPVTLEPTFAVGAAERLFDSNEAFDGYGHRYDVSLDGRQFVLAEPVERESDPEAIHVIMNWYEEFRGREGGR